MHDPHEKGERIYGFRTYGCDCAGSLPVPGGGDAGVRVSGGVRGRPHGGGPRRGPAGRAGAPPLRPGGIGSSLSALGPGSTALLNGLASATLDRVPLLAISGQVESSREQYWTHQLVDQGR